MTAGKARYGAAAVVLAALAASFWLALDDAARFRADQAAQAEKTRLGGALTAAAERLDMAGREALAGIAEGGAFHDAKRAALHMAAGAESEWFALRGLARLERRDNVFRLRDAALAEGPGARPEQAAERAVAFRAAAEKIAERAAPRLEEAFPRAAFLPAGGGRNGFWLIWRRDDGEGALAAAIAPRASRLETATAGDAPRGGMALDLTAAPEEDAPAETDAEADGALRVVAPLGDGAAVLTLAPEPPSLTAADALSAVSRSAPIFGAALLMGLLFLVTMRLAAQRESEMHARCAAVMEGVAEKQKALDDSKARFRHLAETTNVIPWSADLERQSFTYIGPQIEALSGYPAADWLAQGFWAQHIHPQDRHRVLVEAIAAAAEGGYATVDYRIRAANGRVLHLRNMLSVGCDEAGRPVAAQGFLLDVTEMRRAAKALEESRQKAEDANRVKSEFLANMSHELRTPLNAVIGFSEIMKDELFGPLPAKYREYAESVHASGKHLLDLINDVLDLSKIEAGRIELTEDEVDPFDLLTECRRLLKERAASAGLRLELAARDDLPPIWVDERRMKQVVLNLLANAIKFTPPGGMVSLGATATREGGLRLWVRDTGVGMKPEEIPRALSKFGQVDGDLTRRHQGTGLGLPIAKSLAEIHGGAFEIASTPGEGTEVSITLPPERLRAPAEDPAEDKAPPAARPLAPAPEPGLTPNPGPAPAEAESLSAAQMEAWGRARRRGPGAAGGEG